MEIRKDQLTTFKDRADAQFENRLTAHLSQRHGNLLVYTKPVPRRIRVLSLSELLPLVRVCIDRARRWGMAWESSIAAFTVLMFINGPNFDEDPAVRGELQNSAIPADSLPDHIAKAIPKTAWPRIRARYRHGWDEMSRVGQNG